jgi:hypothetical protein
MSYKVDFAAADVQWQILALKEFPKIANTHFYPAMHRAVKALKAEIVPNVPVASGKAAGTFKTQVSGNGLNIQARAGWFGNVEAWYINIQEYGAREHEQGYIPRLGLSIKHHPGVPALKFMERGFKESQSEIDIEMLKASEGVVNELATK